MKSIIIWSAIITFCICLAIARWASGDEIGTASWYSTKESKGVMANGHKFDDTKLICASWGYPFGTKLQVTSNRPNSKVVVEVADRGPSQPKCSCIRTKNSRIIDLSKRAFSEIANLKSGLIQVKIEVIE